MQEYCWVFSKDGSLVKVLTVVLILAVPRSLSKDMCFSLQLMKVKLKVAHSCLSLCNPMDCNLPISSVHGVLQARILEWVAISFSRGSSQPRDWTRVSRIAARFFTPYRENVFLSAFLQNQDTRAQFPISKLGKRGGRILYVCVNLCHACTVVGAYLNTPDYSELLKIQRKWIIT